MKTAPLKSARAKDPVYFHICPNNVSTHLKIVSISPFGVGVCIAKKGSNKFLISAVFEIDTKKIILLFELCNLVQLSTNNLS